MDEKEVFLSIIIVCWNALGDLQDCIASLAEQTFTDFELIVVDNNSTDGTREYLKNAPVPCRIIYNESNFGFCKANNQGIKIAKGEVILVLNADVVLESNFLEFAMQGITSAHSSMHMFQPKVLRKNKKTIDTTGLIVSPFIRFFDCESGERDDGRIKTKDDCFTLNPNSSLRGTKRRSNLVVRLLRCFAPRNDINRDLYNINSSIIGPCGCAAFYRKKALDKIKDQYGYFDERFFFLLEDFDVAIRMRKKGYFVKYIPSAVCYHSRSHSKHPNRYKQFLSYKNRKLFIKKHIGKKYYIRYLHVFIFYDIPRFLYLFLLNTYVRQHMINPVNSSFKS